MEDKNYTIKDTARMAGVSAGTVRPRTAQPRRRISSKQG